MSHGAAPQSPRRIVTGRVTVEMTMFKRFEREEVRVPETIPWGAPGESGTPLVHHAAKRINVALHNALTLNKVGVWQPRLR